MNETPGYAGAALITLCQLPQIWRTLRTRRVEGISTTHYGLLAVGIALMLFYALDVGRTPFVLSNAAALTLVGFQLLLLGIVRRADSARRRGIEA